MPLIQPTRTAGDESWALPVCHRQRLYDLVMDLKPLTIVDGGTGCWASAFAMASALADLAIGDPSLFRLAKVITVDVIPRVEPVNLVDPIRRFIAHVPHRSIVDVLHEMYDVDMYFHDSTHASEVWEAEMVAAEDAGARILASHDIDLPDTVPVARCDAAIGMRDSWSKWKMKPGWKVYAETMEACGFGVLVKK